MKNVKTALHLLTGLLIIIAFSCKKETAYLYDYKKTPPIVSSYEYDKGEYMEASFLGSILDENKQVVEGAKVTIGNRTILTNEHGVFKIENVSVNENHAYIKVEKEGYFLGSRSTVPTKGSNKIEITLLKKKQIGSFESSTGGTVSGDGITIDFKAGVVDAYGFPYSGKVKVAAKYIDPESPEISSIMPGNLIGSDENGSCVLKSLGMVAAQITDGKGNELQLAKGSKAEISFPLSPTLLADAPKSIPLWYFDEVNGIWSHEGSATLEGSTYKASVSHFSFWNCDIRYDYTMLNGRVVDKDGNGIANIRVDIISTLAGSRTTITDNLGYFGGIVPANQELILKSMKRCGANYQSPYSQNIGSLSSPATIPDLDIINSGLITVTGIVEDCDNNIVSDGYIIDQYNNVHQLNSGKFSITSCPNTTLNLKAIDNNNKTESKDIEVKVLSSSIDIGNIVACHSYSNFIKWKVDDKEYLATNCYSITSSNTYGTSVHIKGNEPDKMHFSLPVFKGVGTYEIGPNSNHIPDMDLGPEGLPEQWDSGKVSIKITRYGKNYGQRIEGIITGKVSGINTLSNNKKIRVTKNITGTIKFDVQ